MPVSNDISQHSPASQHSMGPTLGWRELAIQRPTPRERRRRRILGILGVLLLITVVFAAVRLAAITTTINDQLDVHIGSQQVITLDLRQGLPISPTILGTNVSPRLGTTSLDNVNGFMDYSPPLTAGLVDAHVKLLDFPGGNWGEDHYLSRDQLNAFVTLLAQVHADGIVQTRLSALH